ncbi:unnamed protein product [Bursaphelenchus okinawaensis]|uniref:Uncharacterized protein n=1 Tax=Bursaphelenchus okinawaensis TaxID=465554 RepID=A0A811LLG0_9BILA|nr:unnamed protein product [Bursaphelenchus okinawaensis]CAG9125729.1 unnamed protein product [Bursaphelenchus okinawaensis]
MSLQKIAGGSGIEDGMSVQIDETVYIFETKYEDQTEYHNGHRIIANGSRCQSFNTYKKEWSTISEVPAILEESQRGKLDELLFLHSGTLFLLLFNRFEGLSLHSLWRFETQNSRFTKHSDINHQIVAPGDENTYGSHLKLVEGNQFNIPAPYFIVKLTNLEYEFVVFHLEIAIGHTVSEILKRVKSLQPVINAMDPHPVSALYYQNNIYITVAERGCGLKWKTDQIIKFDINEKTLQPIDVSTELFVLALPRFDFYYPISNQWLHFGSTTKNENGNNTIFVLKDITRSPHWIKYELPLDDVNFTDHFLTTDTSNVVTVLRKDAVYQFDINYLQ